MLYLRGDQESTENYSADVFQARAGGPCDVQIIPDYDHFYNGRENAVIEHVTGWLAGLSPTTG